MIDMSAAEARPRRRKKKTAAAMAGPEDREENEKRPMFEKRSENLICGDWKG